VEAFPFRHRQRVRFGETDLQKVVYYANYLLYAEVGRVAYLRELGLPYGELIAKARQMTEDVGRRPASVARSRSRSAMVRWLDCSCAARSVSPANSSTRRSASATASRTLGAVSMVI